MNVVKECQPTASGMKSKRGMAARSCTGMLQQTWSYPRAGPESLILFFRPSTKSVLHNDKGKGKEMLLLEGEQRTVAGDTWSSWLLLGGGREGRRKKGDVVALARQGRSFL